MRVRGGFLLAVYVTASLLRATDAHASSAVLTSSASPALMGRLVTLSATVTPSSATGVVTFYDGTSILGTRTIAGGKATLSTSLLQPGSRSLHAFYSGDTNNTTVSSPALSLVVHTTAQNGFQSALHLNAGPTPAFTVVGDFNGDNKSDLAVVNQQNNSVTVLLGNGDGTFATGVTYPVGGGPLAMATGDFNGDGKTDLAVANSTGQNVSVLLGNGDGTFQIAVNYGAGDGAQSIVVADLNGDGRADLAVANANANNVSILMGMGDGTFQAAVNFAAGTSPFSVVAGDFNGDGKTDLAIANFLGGVGNSGNVSVLLGNGSGGFQAAVNYAADQGPVSIAAGDLNGDGKPDLAVANLFGNKVSVLLGVGDGTFSAAVNYGASSPQAVVMGEFNGDGKLDVVSVNQQGDGVSVLLGNGDGTLQGALNDPAGVTAPGSIAVGDFNADGRPDLVVTAAFSSSLSILLGQAPGTTVNLSSTLNPASYGSPLTLMVTVSPTAATGNVTFFDGSAVLGTRPVSGGRASLSTVLLTSGKHQLSAYYGGDSTYSAGQSAALPQTMNAAASGALQTGTAIPLSSTPRYVAAGDFNADGKPDLVIVNPPGGNITVLLGSGGGLFQAGVNYSTGGGGPAAVTIADFNGDGRSDIAVVN